MDQAADGAEVLHVNCAVAGLNEAQLLRQAVSELCMYSGLPLCIATQDPAAAEAALRLYPGRAMLKIAADGDSAETLLPIAAKYGAMLILSANDAETLQKFVEKATTYGIAPEECIR